MFELSWPWLLLLLPLPWFVKSRQQQAAAGLLLPPLAKVAQQHAAGISRQQKPKQWQYILFSQDLETLNEMYN